MFGRSVLVVSIVFSVMSCSKEVSSDFFSGKTVNHIEGAKPAVLKEHKALLKSVVHFANLRSGSCTATLIQKDVLLTAKHCVDLYNPKGIINSVAASSIQTVVSADTDLALVKFISNVDLDKKLMGAVPVEIATEHRETLYASEVLLAGYGMINDDSTSGILYAGTNTVVESDPATKALLESLHGPKSGSKYPLRSDYIHLFGKRETTYESFQYVEGFTVSVDGGLYYSADTKTEKYVDGNSTALPGDSGGPLIGFENGRPILIGVASDVCIMCAGSKVKEVTIRDHRLKTQKTVKLKDNVKGTRHSVNATLLGVLAKEGILALDPSFQEGYVTTTDFDFEFKLDRMVVNGYVSTTDNSNSKFILKTLKQFGY